MLSIILAILALVGNCGWFMDGRKHRHDIRKAKAEAEQAEFSLSKDYVREFRENIYLPLEEELHKLRQAIEKASTCSYSRCCPVTHELCESPPDPPPESRDDYHQGEWGGGGG